jgi:hypothetical protein
MAAVLVDSPGGRSENTRCDPTRRLAVDTTPATPEIEKGTPGDVWAFRAFVILFLLTLLIGLTHFLLMFLKYRS